MFPGISPLPQGAVIDPGSVTYNVPGEYDFVCPNFNTLTVTVKGGGGGGASFTYINTVTAQFVVQNTPTDTNLGGISQFNETVAGGGAVYGSLGDRHVGSSPSRTVGTAGINGSATGGDTNTAGGGSAGGAGGADDIGTLGGAGGAGGKAIKAYSMGDLIVGQSYPIVVGSGGAGITCIDGVGFAHPQGYVGTDGSVLIEWT